VVHHHYHTENQQLEDLKRANERNAADNQELREKLQQAERDNLVFDNQMRELKLQLENESNPDQYAAARERVFNAFLEKLDKSMFETKIFRQEGKKNIGMFGVISAGKSMLVNALFDDPTKCETGKGETTKEIKDVGECHGVCLWDLPGNSIHFNFLQFDHLCFLTSLTQVCICVDTSLHDPFYHDLLRICHKLEVDIIIALTKMDDASEEERQTQPMQIRIEASELGFTEARVFSISAVEKLRGVISYDWGAFIEELCQRR